MPCQFTILLDSSDDAVPATCRAIKIEADLPADVIQGLIKGALPGLRAAGYSILSVDRIESVPISIQFESR